MVQKNQYFYKGIPLSKYCKENDLNVDSIRTRIWKKKQSKKYESYTEQEIVNMVVEAYGSNIKYTYKGMSLGQYCQKNDINIKTIYARIVSLKKKNKDLTNDELVVLAMEEFKNQNFRFFYKGIPLKEYCKEHLDINYNTIRSYINVEKERNPSLTDEELIEQYISKEQKGRYTYYYLGIPLKQYCEENNLNYKNIIAYIRYHASNNPEIQYNNEFIEAIIDHYQPFEPKYLYKGITLREYCIQNDLSYYSVVSFVKRKLANGSTKSIDDLIDEGIKTINRYGIIYYYNGVPLKDYCKENGLNVSSIRCTILRKRAKTNQPLQEIVNYCVETYQKFPIKYYYNGESLLSYCKKIGLNYSTVIKAYLENYSYNSEISTDEAIKQIVDYYLENPPVKTKYYFNDLSLSKFCDINGYSYLAIWRRMQTLQNKKEVLSDEQIIEIAIKKYEDRLYINKINEIFKKIENIEVQDYNELRDVCEFLKIDFENVLDLIDMDFSYSQAINLIWYFSDKKSNNDFKIITDYRLKSLFLTVNNLKTAKESDIENFELYDLIGIYKSGLYDSRNEILIRQKRYIYHTIYSLCRNYDIEINKGNFEDFKSEIKLYLISVINRTNLNVCGQIIKYMDLTIKGYFRTYLKQYKKQNSSLSLYNAKYSKERGTKKEKAMIDYVADPNNPFEDLDSTSFSSTMMQVLSNLPKEDLLFIMLKFQENYTDIELAEYFIISIEEVKEKEIRILSLLKDNSNVQALKKTK